MDELKKTCLHDLHLALGATMSPFAGYDMPIEYEGFGIEAEHNAVRNACGVFDVSHMGEIGIYGNDAEYFVNRVFTNDVTAAPIGQCFYGMMLNEDGGVVDDLLVYKRDHNHFLFVVNAANIEKDERWVLRQAEGYDLSVELLSGEMAEIAVQGPKAEELLCSLLEKPEPVRSLAFYTFCESTRDNNLVVISRTGYTGEDGFEVYSSEPYVRALWQKLLDKGAVPCGLGCRDTLRFEVGLPLYGNELADDITPLEAGLGMFVKLEKPDLIGGEALRRQKEEGPKRKLVGLLIHDRAIARHGCDVLNAEGEVIGHVTTGYRSISTGDSVAMALIDARYAARDTELQVQVRRKRFPATVVPKKFFKKNYKK